MQRNSNLRPSIPYFFSPACQFCTSSTGGVDPVGSSTKNRLPSSDTSKQPAPETVAQSTRMVKKLDLAENTRYRQAGFEVTRSTLRDDFCRM